MYVSGCNPATTWDVGGTPDYGWSAGQVAFLSGATGWMAFEASSDVTFRQAVILDQNFKGAPLTKALLDANLAMPIGAAGADVKAGENGWMQIWGPGRIAISAGGSLGSNLYSSSTAGGLDDISSSQTRIHRVSPYVVETSAGSARVQFNWPSGTD